jgi:iron(III) transport system ATP-binding protein
MLEVHHLTKRVSDVFSLREVSFSQKNGERLAIAGSSGSGKSTLLQLIAGLQSPDQGSIHLSGQRVKGPHEQLIPGHPGLAYLPQQPDLPHHYFVHELFSYANQWDTQLGKDLFSWCRIDHLMDRQHTQLSGGEQQRIALALLLIASPRWLLLDEPFSHLDSISKAILQQVLLEVTERLSITCLLCSHHPEDIFTWADRLLVIRDGSIIADGNPEFLYRQPADTYVAGLLGEFELLSETHARILQHNSQHLSANMKRFIRPEMLQFSREQVPNSIPCQIISSQFAGRGRYYRVKCDEAEYRLYSLDQQYSSGSNGYIHLLKQVESIF